MAKKSDKSPKPEVSVATITRCAKCGSTEREPYAGVTTRDIAGTDAVTGQPYTHVIWRRTKCRGCGQARIDRHTENRTTGKPAA